MSCGRSQAAGAILNFMQKMKRGHESSEKLWIIFTSVAG